MTRLTKFAVIGGACLALGACGSDESTQETTSGSVGGKILARSVTDEMLPYDTLTSQPPRAKPATGSGVAATGQEPDTSASAGPAEEEAGQPSQAATPAEE